MNSPALFRSRVVGVAIGLYIVFVLVASFHFNVSLSPDRIMVLLLIVGLATNRARLFLKDWSLFLVVLLAWQVLSSFSRHIGHLKPHVSEMITVDRTLFFGHVPTIWLQHHFYHLGHIQWYDLGATILYMLHFIFPIGVAFVLWAWRRPAFLEFMVAFLLLALSGFVTFVLFPAAPPWIAGDWWHRLPHVYRIFNAGISYFGGSQSYSTLYRFLWQHGGWDVFGAVPSEHAAFPFLCFLYARKVWPRAGWLLLPYCAVVGVAVVYLGEHYVTDVILGILYASAVYVVVQYLVGRRSVKFIQARAEKAPTSPAA